MIATSAEVEAHDLRVLIDDQRIIIKPVHRIALREALAAAFGVKLATTEEPRSMSSGVPRLEGHVLVVEDEPVNAAVAEGYLQALGCTSVWATSGTDAVARRVAERFDLVLMDLSMPDMDGHQIDPPARRTRHTDTGHRVNGARCGQDLRAAVAICHKLASSAANVGALAYGKEVRRLEQSCIAGDHAQASAVNQAIQAAHPALVDTLTGLTLRASA